MGTVVPPSFVIPSKPERSGGATRNPALKLHTKLGKIDLIMADPNNTVDMFARTVAIYGAIISTLGLAWQLYQRWIRGPKLVVSCSPNMVLAGNGSIGTQRHLGVTVNNSGTEITTITNVILAGYSKDVLKSLRNKGRALRQAVVMTGGHGNTVPFEIKVGGRFMAMAIQNDELEKWSVDERLFVGITHSFSERVCWCRVKPIKSKMA